MPAIPREEQEAASRLYREGRAHREAGRLEEAIASLERSARLVPHFKTLEVLGECYVKLGRYREAIVPLAAAAGLNRQVRAPSLLAKVFLELGDSVKAREIARDVQRREAGNRLAKAVLAATQDLAKLWDPPAAKE